MARDTKRVGSLLLFFVGAFLLSYAQGTRADYERAANLRQQTQNKVFKSRVQPNWFENNRRFWYRNDLANGQREFIVVDAVKGKREPAFEHARMAEALSKALNKQVQANQLPIEWLDFHKDGLLFLAQGKTWEYDPHTHTLHERTEVILNTPALTALRTIRPSQRTGDETLLTFINKTNREVVIFWMDTEGKRQRYATLQPGEQRNQQTYGGHIWLVTDEAEKLLAVFEASDTPGTAIIDGTQPVPRERESPERRETGISPDGAWQAVVKEHNLYLRRRASEEEFALTTDGTQEDRYSAGIYWSPDSKRLVAPRIQVGQEHKVYLIESSPQDQRQPKLHALDYLKPGDKVPVVRLRLFEIESRKQTLISESLYLNPWQVTDVRWEPDSRRFTFVYNQRGHQVLRVIAVDAQTGEAKAIIDERSKTFIDYS
jgi:dipeptidyl-peptidase-4